MFRVAQKFALAESSAQEFTNKKKDKHHDLQKNVFPNFLKRKDKSQSKRPETFTPLNVPKASLVAVIKEKFGVKDPIPMRPQSFPTQDKIMFCNFHRDYKHTTEDCIELKRTIE